MTLTNILGWYLLIINFAAFYLYWDDKRRAKKEKWRIKESTLLLVGSHCSSYKRGNACYRFRRAVPCCYLQQEGG